ncbi:MAG TPA: asparagine synthase (glutamine-hydrolyzing), partial [Beijerinckiaceae bacterium]|nr:asparagine synthase (glutamine-hydrolyzing) [Beijerinckiaceae bacterium]
MCGITGFIDVSRSLDAQALEGIARDMAGAMPHRGPDDDGTLAVAEHGVAFGFRRLAIIDLTPAGHQPMTSGDGRWSIVYNGEIYNAEDMRPPLVARGVRFRGHSDTEVLLESFSAFGVEATLTGAIGMFAMAVHDRERGETWFARDRLGKKPLYIGRFGKTFMFGSELRCLRAHPDFRAELDETAIASYARFGYIPHPLCIYRGVTQLAPGGLARLSREGDLKVGHYWDPAGAAANAKQQGFSGSPEEAVEELDRLLRDAVGRRMVSDVPLGAFLSGGIDSSVVVALMQAQSARPVKTFSIGFHVDGFDEAPHAKAVATHLGTEHHELYVQPQDALDVVPMLPTMYDEPFSDSSQIPTYLVSRMAREHVTVALSGDGGDESFAGYTRYRQIGALFGDQGPASGAATLLARLAGGLSAPLGRR